MTVLHLEEIYKVQGSCSNIQITPWHDPLTSSDCCPFFLAWCAVTFWSCLPLSFFLNTNAKQPTKWKPQSDIQYNPQTERPGSASLPWLFVQTLQLYTKCQTEIFIKAVNLAHVLQAVTCTLHVFSHMFARTAGTLNAQHRQRFLWSLIPSLQKQRSFPHFPIIHPQTAGIFQGCVSNWQVRVLLGAGSARSELSTLILA